MNEVNAWEKFVSSGSVNDYLKYANTKKNVIDKEQESINSAVHYQRPYSNGAKYRGIR